MLWLGIDSGTQSLKGTVYDDAMVVVAEHNVDFAKDLWYFHTKNGEVEVELSDGQVGVRSPVLMWMEALDYMLQGLARKVDLGQVAGISGSAQQHSSVWWTRFPDFSLFDPSVMLAVQLSQGGYFALELSPIWADSSTSQECREVEQRIGGSVRMAELTGSISLERFTGNQIAKIAKLYPDVYARTGLIQLLSAALCSIFIGRPAPTDFSDGAGMNMMDINRLTWLPNLGQLYGADDLDRKVGSLCSPSTVVGTISPYFVHRFGFSPACNIVAFTGDNPSSLVGAASTNLDDLVISLGTSDTVLSQQRTKDQVDVTGGGVSVFPHPISFGMYMVMICYKNGGAVRAHVKTEQKSWDEFDKALLSSSDSTQETVCFFHPQPEIAPRPSPSGMHAFVISQSGDFQAVHDLNQLTWEQQVRGVIISKALAIKSHLDVMNNHSFKRIILTGGGSKSKGIQAIFAHILGVDVVTLEESGSAARGAAIRSMVAMNRGNIAPPKLSACISPNHTQLNVPISLDTFRELENTIFPIRPQKKQRLN